MAKRRTKSKGRKKGGRGLKRRIAIVLLLALVAVLAYGYVSARVVHVEYVEAYVSNLAPFLDGVTVLFASDFKITGQKSARRAAALMNDLAELRPDIVLLGGDYTAMSFWDLFRAQTEAGVAAINERLKQARMTFFAGISDMRPQAGMFAVGGEGDRDIAGLSEDCALAGARLLENQTWRAVINDTPIYIAGLRDYVTGDIRSYKYGALSASDCVLLICHNPDAYALLSSVTDALGDPLADLIFAGHTLGGQARAFGAGLMAPVGAYDGKFMYGAYNETGPDMLVSSGVGTQWIPLRFGTRAQVYMVTLKRK